MKVPRFSNGKRSAAAQTARSCESLKATMPPWSCHGDGCQRLYNVQSVFCVGLRHDKAGGPFLDRPRRRISGELFEYLVGSGEQRGRDRNAEFPCGLEIDDRLKVSRLLDRDIGRFRALEDKIDNFCATLPSRSVICSVGARSAPIRLRL